ERRLALDRLGGPRPQIARRDWLTLSERTDLETLGGIVRGRRPAFGAGSEVLIEEPGLGRVDRPVEPLGGPEPCAGVGVGPRIRATRTAASKAHRAPPVPVRSLDAIPVGSASALASGSASAARP